MSKAVPSDNLQELLNAAQGCLLAGDLQGAVISFQSALRLDPRHGVANYWLGVLALKAEVPHRAVSHLEIAAATNPDFIDCHLDLGLAYRATNLPTKAEEAFQNARNLAPTYATLQASLALSLEKDGKREEAIEACNRGLLLFPGNIPLLRKLADLYLKEGRWPKALETWKNVLGAVPNCANTHLAFGQACNLAGQIDLAAEAFKRAADLQPGSLPALAHLGLALQNLGRLEEAAACLTEAAAIGRNAPDVQKALGDVLRKLERWEEACAAWRKAVELKPDYADAWQNLGLGLEILFRLEEAVQCHQRVVEQKPNDPTAYRYLGMVYQDLGIVDAARQAYETALQFGASDAECHWQKFSLMASLGEFPDAWEEYEWRWEIKNRTTPKRTFVQPKWNGEPLNGRTILLYSEQGFGDTIQIVRYVSMVKERGGRVLLWSPPELVPLLRTAQGVDEVFSQLSKETMFDCQVALMSLPLVFKSTLESIPKKVPYLQSVKESAIELPSAKAGRPKVGLVWSGSRSQPNDRRPVPFELMLPLLARDDVEFYSLQVGTFAGDLQKHPLGKRVHDLSVLLKDFSVTASAIEQLDLIITIDTSVAHLAGALGKKTWTLLSFAPDWRWMIQRDDSPWYPTMRLFRQRRPGNWVDVIEQVSAELSGWVEQWNSSTYVRSWLGQAFAHHGAWRLEQAAGIYQKVLEVNPNQADALRLFGVLQHQIGNLGMARELLERAVAVQPGTAEANHDLGLVLAESGRLEEALRAYDRALSANGELPDIHYNRGNALYSLKRLDEALFSYRRAVSLAPDLTQAHYNLGLIAQELEQLPEAIRCYQQVIALDENHLDALLNLGLALKDIGQLEQSEQCLRKLLNREPSHKKALVNLAAILVSLHTSRRELTEAYQLCDIVLQDDPTLAEAWLNRGVVEQALGDVEAAKQSFSRVLQLQPDNADARFNLGIAELLSGDFQKGWQNYEARWETQNRLFASRGFPFPCWRGENLAGATVLVHAEQGLGDAIQFVRYVPMLAEQAGHVIVECPASLKKLFISIRGVSQVLARGEAIPKCDFHVPMMSLPLRFGTVRAQVPYLNVPEGAEYKEACLPKNGPKVGIVWSGSPHHAGDRRRSISLDQLARLWEIRGISLISLQVGPAAQQLLTTGHNGRIIDLGSTLRDFAETAALMQRLDLIITVDTAVAHLAGALGRPVWVLLPYAPDWRWLLQREDSPWYPTMRLFRQPEPGDWTTAVRNVAFALSRG